MKAKILTFALSGLFAASVFASTSVAVVDLDQTFQQVPQGQSAFMALKQQVAPQVAQFQTQQQALQTQANALQNAKLSKSQLSTKQAQLATQQQSLAQSMQTFQQNVSNQQKQLLTVFGNDLQQAVAQITKKEGYDIVLSKQSVIYTANANDITQEVIKNMDTLAANEQQQAQQQQNSASAQNTDNT